jgi:hypothetical protein
MTSTIDLAGFAERVHEFIRAAAGLAKQPLDEGSSFDRLGLELFALQFKRNAAYRRFCESRHLTPGVVRHWAEVPSVPAAAFKEYEFSCLSPGERTAVFCSSGTTGQHVSRHFHGAKSLALYEESLLGWFNEHIPMADGQSAIAIGRASDVGTSWAHRADWQALILTPPPAQAPHSSLVHMFETIRRKLKGAEGAFVGTAVEGGGWDIELDAAVRAVEKLAASRRPALVLGTAFSFVHLLDQLGERRLQFRLPAGSCALETGGYKGRSRQLPKAALHALITQGLGIPADHIICEYGMSELSSQAYDGAVGPSRALRHKERCFQFPPWARARVVSPETGREVGVGESGLIRVWDLANVWSVMAIQTEDLALRRQAGFELIGRAAVAEPRGCSLMAV